MKKILLFVMALTIGLSVIAQRKSYLIGTTKYTAPRMKKAVDGDVIGMKPVNSTVTIRAVTDDPIIMTTKYDLQSNASTRNHLYKYADGTMAGVSTMSHLDDFTDRGTGYNYFDGTAWGTAPGARIESVRTGWGNYAPCGPNGEIVISHISGTAGIVVCKRATKGTGAWVETSIAAPAGATGMLWPRLVSSGPDHNTIHIIALTAPVANGGGIYQDLDGALLYIRSLDGGTNWEGWQMLPEMTSAEYLGFAADAYAFAEPRGDTIAFAYGDSWTDLTIMKSTDNGATWNKITIWPCPYNKWAGGDSTGYHYAPDGNLALALDKHGKVHLSTGLENVYGLEDGSQYWTINQDGLLYWNENMPTWPEVLDIYELEANGNIVGWCPDTTVVNNPIADFAYWYCSMSSMPTIVADEFDNIFVVWASITNLRDQNNYMMRHLIARASTTGGQTWHETLLDITGDFIQYNWSECVYPNAAPFSYNDSLYILFQSDSEASAYWKLQGSGQGQMDITVNDIIVMKTSKQAIINPGVGIEEPGKTSFSVSQNMPNPFHSNSVINVNLETAANLSLAVYSVIGQKVLEISKGSVNSGAYQFMLDGTELQPGVYFYTVKVNKESVTKKMIVK